METAVLISWAEC